MENLSPPLEIDKYRIIKRISEGASGVVFLVESEGKQLALKHLKASDEDTIKRFRKESSTLARLDHDGLVKIYDVGEYKSAPYMVMEYLQGSALSDLLSRHTMGLEVDAAVNVIVEVARALTELHKYNLVHRDIKPANILVNSSNRVKLIDFGLVGDVDQLKTTNALFGTPIYCAPEQSMVLKRPVDFRSDLYSLGVTFFEAISGKLPFTGSISEILQKHAAMIAPDVREIRSQVPSSIALIIKKMLAKDPDDRYQSAAGLLFDLDRYQELDSLIASGGAPNLGSQDRRTLTVKTKYIERTVEARQLKDCWASISKGKSGIAIVEGPSGSGKSRLCEEFVQSLDAKDILVIRGKCQFFDVDLPFAPIREAIDGLFDDISSLPEAIRDEYLSKISAAASGAESYLPQLTPSFRRVISGVEIQTESDLNTGDRKTLFFTHVANFFINLSRHWKAVIFLIDDLQWLDQSTLTLLNKTFEIGKDQPLLLLGTARTDDASAKQMNIANNYFGDFVMCRLAIDKFSRNQMESFVTNHLGTSAANPKITEVINFRSDGNPFIALEILRSGIEQGFIFFRENQWDLNEENLEKIALADNVYQMILKRVEGSTPEAKEILRFAALQGSVFKANDLSKVVQIGPDNVNASLAGFQDMGLIERQSLDRWRFAHDKFSESIRTSLTDDERKDIAFRLASFYHSKAEKTPDEVFALARLSTLVERSDFLSQTISANLEAGKLSIANFAHNEGYKYLLLAYDLAKQHGVNEPHNLAQITSKLAICATMVAEWDVANECSQVFYKIAQSKDQQFESEILKTWVLKNQGDTTTAWDFFRLACKSAGEPYPWYLHWKLILIIYYGFIVYFCELLSINWLPEKPNGTHSRTNADLISLYYEGQSCAEYLNKWIDVLLIALKLIVRGRSTQDPIALALGYTNMCYFLKNFGPVAIGKWFGHKAEELTTKITDRTVVAKIEYGVFISKVQAGTIRLDDADLIGKLDQAKNYLPAADYGTMLVTSGYFYMLQGQFDKCLNLVSKALLDHEYYIKRIGMQNRVGALGQQWLMLSCLGRTQESQASKKEFLALNNRMRFTPSTARSAITFETLNYRFLDASDNRTFELMEIAFSRTPILINYPAYKFNESVLSFLCLEMLENATQPDAIYGLSRKFKQGMMRLYLTSYNNEMKLNYSYLLARYYAYRGNPDLSEKLYQVSERIALKFQNARLLFDIYRDKARHSLRKNDFFGLNVHLGMALQLASSKKWQPLIDRLKFEFDEHFENLTSRTAINISGQSTSLTQVTSVASRNRANSTHASSSSSQTTIQAGKATAMGRVQARVDIEEMRFVDALLNVSTAFVSSIDLVEQSSSVLTEIVKLFVAERGFVFLKENEESELKILAGRGSDGSTLRDIRGFSSTVVKKVVETGKPIIVTGTEEGEVLGSESAVLHGLRSIMATPLNLNGAILGVVYVDSSLTKGLFTTSDIELFSTLANHISVAFQLSRMAKFELEKTNLRRELEVQTVIASEGKKVKALVDNVQQALFAVTADGSVVEPVSRYSENIFRRNIIGENVMSALFKDLSEQKEKFEAINSTFMTVFGEDELQWNLLASNIPRKISYHGQEDHTLKIKASPIWDDRSNLEKILFVVEDITDLESLERQVQKQGLQTAMLEEIFSGKLQDSQEFLKQASLKLADLKRFSETIGSEKLKNILRELHTLKGNARHFNLRRFSEQIHRSESALVSIENVPSVGDNQKEQVLHQLTEVSGILDQYTSLINRVLASQSTTQSSTTIDNEVIGDLIGMVKSLESDPSKKHFARLKQKIIRLGYRSVRDMAQRFDGMIKDISAQLGKNVQLRVVNEAMIHDHHIHLLQESLLHLLRNSLDHGIETVEERTKANKPVIGTITITCQDDIDSITLRIADDGLGMNPDRIVSKAIERGIVTQAEAAQMSPQDKINLIFKNGFSTRDSATDISGRGIGMDVVKLNVEKMGGTIHVETVTGVGSTFIIAIRNTEMELAQTAS